MLQAKPATWTHSTCVSCSQEERIPCHVPSLHRSCPRSLPVRSPPRPPPPLDSPCAPPAARRRSWGCTSVLQAKCAHVEIMSYDRRRSAGDKPLGGGPCSHGKENPVNTWNSDMDTWTQRHGHNPVLPSIARSDPPLPLHAHGSHFWPKTVFGRESGLGTVHGGLHGCRLLLRRDGS